MFSGSSPCLLGQHGSSSSAHLPVELSENMLHAKTSDVVFDATDLVICADLNTNLPG